MEEKSSLKPSIFMGSKHFGLLPRYVLTGIQVIIHVTKVKIMGIYEYAIDNLTSLYVPLPPIKEPTQ